MEGRPRAGADGLRPKTPKAELDKKLARLDALAEDELRALARDLTEHVRELEEKIGELFACVDDQNKLVDVQNQKIVELSRRLQMEISANKKKPKANIALQMPGKSEADLLTQEPPSPRLDGARGCLEAEPPASPARPPAPEPTERLPAPGASPSSPGRAAKTGLSEPLPQAGKILEPLRSERARVPLSARSVASQNPSVSSSTPVVPGPAKSAAPAADVRVAPSSLAQRGAPADGVIRLTLLTVAGGRVQLDVPREETLEGFKNWLVGATVPGLPCGPGAEGARLLFRGLPLAHGVPLQQLGLVDGSVVRLLPPICATGGSSLRRHSRGSQDAPRGLLMRGVAKSKLAGVAFGGEEVIPPDAGPHGAKTAR